MKLYLKLIHTIFLFVHIWLQQSFWHVNVIFPENFGHCSVSVACPERGEATRHQQVGDHPHTPHITGVRRELAVHHLNKQNNSMDLLLFRYYTRLSWALIKVKLVAGKNNDIHEYSISITTSNLQSAFEYFSGKLWTVSHGLFSDYF